MKKCLFLFILLLQNWILFADGFYCKQIGIENGLSQSSVTAVAYDERGVLWIGTRFGLNEYRNGELRTVIGSQDNYQQGTYIYMLYCDSRGTLWTSTDKGLFRYDPAGDAFIQESESTVTCAVDVPGGVWFGAHFGLKFYSFDSGTISGDDSDVYTDYISLFYREGALYSLDRKEGLAVHTPEGPEVVPIPHLDGNLIMSSALDGDVLYISILNYGLLGYDLGERRESFSIGLQNGLPVDPLLALMVYDGALWMGFDGSSIWIMDLQTHEIVPLDRQLAQSGAGIPLSVTTLYQDRHNNIWVGSVRAGLVGLKLSPIKAFSLTGKDPEAENVIIDVLASEDGFVYLGTDGSGLWRYNQESGLSCLAGKDGLKITAIADYDSRNLCVATYNRGYFLVDRKTYRFTPFVLKDKATNAEECFNSNSPSLYTLQDGRMLFLAVHTYLYDHRTRRFLQLTDNTDGEGLELRVIGVSGSGTIYAFSDPGIFTIDTEAMELNLIYRADPVTGNINTAVYHGGMVWFGTNYGLYSFDPRSSQVQKVQTALFSRVSRLESNGADNLWISADNTLFLSRNGVIEMTGENRGVPANEMMAGTCAPDGSVYLGGNAGFVEIGAECYFGDPEDREVALRDPARESLKLPYNYQSLDLSINLVGSDPFERVLYRYMLSGASQITVDSFDQTISLPALKPGHYRLRVSYLKSDGTWSRPQVISNIHIKRPWYLSTPMILLYLAVFIVFALIEIDSLSRRRLRALEKQLKARDHVFTSKVDAFIEQHIAEPGLSVTDLAGHMAMSRATLYYKMNASFGKGVAEVIEEKRMAKAEDLLSTTSFSILDISEKVGYSSPRYFATRFKLLHDGQTPLKYRKAHQ
ncbi:MAG: helix-turn-helix domain-containing protein [Bacteroidales bacterium]|nr:helix-turn-helix domain-containing protein [Bacteroidales bacterium]